MDGLKELIYQKNRQLINDFEERNGTKLVSGFYASDALLFAPDGSKVSGVENIAALFNRILATRTPCFEVRPLSDSDESVIEASGQLAYSVGMYAFSLSAGGRDDKLEAFEGSGKRIVIFKTEDSNLRAVVDIWIKS